MFSFTIFFRDIVFDPPKDGEIHPTPLPTLDETIYLTTRGACKKLFIARESRQLFVKSILWTASFFPNQTLIPCFRWIIQTREESTCKKHRQKGLFKIGRIKSDDLPFTPKQALCCRMAMTFWIQSSRLGTYCASIFPSFACRSPTTSGS